MSLAAILQGAEELVAIVQTAITAGEVVGEIKDIWDSLSTKFKDLFSTKRYLPLTNRQFAFSQHWIRYEDLLNILARLRALTYSDPADAYIIRAYVSCLYNYTYNSFFHPLFPDGEQLVCLSLNESVVKLLTDLQRSISVKPKDPPEFTQRMIHLYFLTLESILDWVNSKDIVYDRNRFETEFNLTIS